MIPSKYQQGIYNHVVDGSGNLIVDAKAGSGKTTTAIEACNLIVEKDKAAGKFTSLIFLAFNKAIATELKSRNVNGSTFHSLCFKPVLDFKKAKTVDANKLITVSRKIFSFDSNKYLGPVCRKLVGLARNEGIGCLTLDEHTAWLALIDKHGLEVPELYSTQEQNEDNLIKHAQQLLRASNDSHLIDFDDLLYLAVKEKITLPKYEWIFVDEAQDTNAIQRAIIGNIMRPDSRLVAIGDPDQSIYGFRGADSDAMGRIKEDFSCAELPLSISYRCAATIVEYAQRWVPNIEASPTAECGQVIDQTAPDMDSKDLVRVGDLNQDDMVVCRYNAPLVRLALKMMSRKMPVKIMGRAFGDGLVSLIRKFNAANIEQLLTKLDAWKNREYEDAIKADNEVKAEAVLDKAEAIATLIESEKASDAPSVDKLLLTIDEIFNESKKSTTLCSIHRSKGLEAKRVIWLARNLCPSKRAKQAWMRKQEIHLCYIAATRAMSTLILCNEKLPE